MLRTRLVRTLVVLGCALAASLAVSAASEPADAAGGGIQIIKRLSGTSCTGYSSQTTPPATIRVLVNSGDANTAKIVVVPFEQYVEDVLPNEWMASWSPAALQAGAVAVKSYAWYWVTHFGGYLGSPGNCFDVTDGTAFQVYRAGSAQLSTTAAVQATWNVVAQRSGQVVQASYICTLPWTPGTSNCGRDGPKEQCGQGANGGQLSQYGSQACAKAGTDFRTILSTYYAGVQLVTAVPQSSLPMIPDDFTFQGTSSPATWNPATGMWNIAALAGQSFQWGLPGDIPAITDFGDGRTLIGVWRPNGGWWYIKDVVAGGWTKTSWGLPGDIPVAAHFRGMHQPTVLAVFRPSNGRWYLYGGGSRTYGQQGDIPVPGHYAGSADDDYADQPAVWRPSTGMWYLYGVAHVQWGIAGDVPVPADYNGDGTTDVAVYRPSTQRWYIRGTPSFRWGMPGDIPVTGDFNGDGKADVAVYRPSTHKWYVRGQAYPVFGAAGDVPIGAAPFSW